MPSPQLAHQIAVSISATVGAGAIQTINLSSRLFSFFFRSVLASQAPATETLADRNARVQHIHISPGRFVGYVGETVSFMAMGVDATGQPAHGAKFDWSTDDTNKVQLDDAGGGTLLRPGLARITCRVGATQASARLLIRPQRRPLQTDEQWRADQDELQPDPTDSVGMVMEPASLLGKLMPTASAQTNSPGDFGNDATVGAVGSPMFTPKEPTRLGSVLSTSNFELAMPLFNLGGRGLATSLNLYYNSNLWGAHFDSGLNSTVYTFDPIQSWPSPGFSLGFGRIVYYNGYTDGNQVAWHQFMLIDADGTRHTLGTGQDLGNNTLQTADGSHLTYVGNGNGGKLYYNDGTAVTIGKVNNRLLPTMITDTNGNYIQIAYKWQTNFPGIAIDYLVDTLGRVIQFNYNAFNSTNLTSITGPNGTVTLNYQTVTMNTSFQGVVVQNQPTSFSAVSSLAVPSRPSYQFSYSGYGMIYQTVANGGGGSGTMTYDYPLGGEDLYGGPTFTQRTESGTNSPTGVYNYGANGVSRPDGSVLSLSSGSQQLKNSSGTVLSKVDTTYTTDPGGSQAVQTVITTDDLGQQTKVGFDYDQYGNVVNQRDYGYQISGQWQVRRRTHYSYINWEPYLSTYIRNRVTETDGYDALLNTNDGDDLLMSKTTASYDSYSAMGSMENYGGTATPPGHLAIYNTTVSARGNLTGSTTYSDLTLGSSETRNKKIDIFGNVIKAQVSCCNEKSFTLTESTYWSKPSQTTSGSTSDIYLTMSAGYDFNTLAVTSNTDPNSQQAIYSYDAAQRVTNSTLPTGASAAIVYNAWGGKTSSSVSYNEGGTNKTLTETAVYDGWGQKTQSVNTYGAQTNYTYDAMGRLLTQTNPFPQGGTPGPVTTNQYDLLGRTTQTTLPGGNTMQIAYSGSVVTMTDQVNRKMKRETDGLGRLIKVTEQDAAGTLAQATNYTYDAADRLIGVNQGNQLRSYQYDAMSRMIAEKSPEQGDPTQASQWTTTYTYTNWGAVSTRQDARGVVTSYTYDTLHRLTNISYDTSQAANVAATPAITYAYDTNQASNTKGLLLSVTAAGLYTESYAYDNSKRVQTMTQVIDGRSYATNYQYDTANQVTQMTYPSNRIINIGHDTKGRVTSVGSFLSSVSYNGIGQMIGDSLGNGVTESFGYDANRMQLTSQTATRSGWPQNGLMNLTYGYNASAGQMGAGTTAGNTGQLMNVSGTINATTESASYTYDNLGRLVTSNQTSNGSTAQRRFAYDRWGNRTGVWDATSGGNQIQSVSLQTASFPGTGSAPTNRLTSVTGGTTVNYTYDASGNVTNDGTHRYTYDGENRLVSVDGGTTASYAYDQQNRRVKKIVGGVTVQYVWQGSQVLAEYNGGSGALLTEYVYSGSRMLAKVESGTASYFLSDRLSIRLMLDGGGAAIGQQSHLPFGEDFAESGVQQKQHLTGYERDSESGMDYAVNRQYSQSIGRFNRPDPYSGSNRLSTPQSLNRYAYVHNDPINATDPLGLEDYTLIRPWEQLENGCYHGVYVGAGGAVFSVTICPKLPVASWPAPPGGRPNTPINVGTGGQSRRFVPDGERDCKKFVNWVVGLADDYANGGDTGALGMGLQFGAWAQEYRKADTTNGFQTGLHEPLQHGEMYEHLLAFAGLTLAANFAGGAAERGAFRFTMNQALLHDLEQVAQGRRESQAEVADDYAGMTLGDLLTRRFRGEIDSGQLKHELRGLLCQ